MQAPRQIRNLALVGFMGTGKTSVGHLAAAMLGFTLLDTDQIIEERARRRITEIFAEEGEAAFRARERELVLELASSQRAVISTGGGLITHPDNLASLKSHALVVCLWASPETIWQRVRYQGHRPLLNDPDPLAKIQRLLAERKPFYLQADVLIGSDLRSAREVAAQVVHHFHAAQKSPPRS